MAASHILHGVQSGKAGHFLFRGMKMNAARELPKYRSHKEVRALKIKAVYRVGLVGERIMVSPVEEGYPDFEVTTAYVTKHEPMPGGYYVVYEDGYKSWSPAEAFEGGYTAIP